MHIRDGILSNEVCLVTGVCAAAAVGYSLWRLRREATPPTLSETGTVGALIFAGQMLNFPLLGLPVSGHLLGGALAAAWLGPWAGCLVLTAVLAVQAIVFGDGGVFALGANVLNMAVIGAWGGAALLSALSRLGSLAPRGRWLPAAITAVVTVMLAATAFCLQLAASLRLDAGELRSLFSLMLGYHALIGLGEAVLTVAGLALLGGISTWTQPQTAAADRTPLNGWQRFALLGLITACLIAGVLSPWASPLPDGLDAVGDRLAFNEFAQDRPLLFDDYALPLPDAWSALSLPLAGIVGTLLTFATALVLTSPRQFAVSPTRGDNSVAN